MGFSKFISVFIFCCYISIFANEKSTNHLSPSNSIISKNACLSFFSESLNYKVQPEYGFLNYHNLISPLSVHLGSTFSNAKSRLILKSRKILKQIESTQLYKFGLREGSHVEYEMLQMFQQNAALLVEEATKVQTPEELISMDSRLEFFSTVFDILTSTDKTSSEFVNYYYRFKVKVLDKELHEKVQKNILFAKEVLEQDLPYPIIDFFTRYGYEKGFSFKKFLEKWIQVHYQIKKQAIPYYDSVLIPFIVQLAMATNNSPDVVQKYEQAELHVSKFFSGVTPELKFKEQLKFLRKYFEFDEKAVFNNFMLLNKRIKESRLLLGSTDSKL